ACVNILFQPAAIVRDRLRRDGLRHRVADCLGRRAGLKRKPPRREQRQRKCENRKSVTNRLGAHESVVTKTTATSRRTPAVPSVQHGSAVRQGPPEIERSPPPPPHGSSSRRSETESPASRFRGS